MAVGVASRNRLECLDPGELSENATPEQVEVLIAAIHTPGR